MASAIVKNIVQTWYKKGTLETDPFNKFICFWISFNAIYMSRYPVDGDKACIREVKKDAHFTSEYKNLLKGHAFQNKITALIALGTITNEKNGDRYSFSTNDFPALIEVLYQIRNNLFHGGKNVSEQRDLDVVSAAHPILSELLTRFMTYI
jgi:hypothetical protein